MSKVRSKETLLPGGERNGHDFTVDYHQSMTINRTRIISFVRRLTVKRHTRVIFLLTIRTSEIYWPIYETSDTDYELILIEPRLEWNSSRTRAPMRLSTQ